MEGTEGAAMERLAIHLQDLDSIHPSIRGKLLAARLKLAKEDLIRLSEKDVTDVAVEFKGELLDAAIVCDIVRAEALKNEDKMPRIYINKGKGWTKVAIATPLVVKKGDKTVLNPLAFTSTIEKEVVHLETPKSIISGTSLM